MPFNIYFAGETYIESDDYIRERGGLRLFSYADNKKLIDRWREFDCGDRLLIDSGAFSVAHRGISIDVDEYIRYINDNVHISNWVELDTIPYPILNPQTAKDSCEKSWASYNYMRPQIRDDANLLPLYHFGEPEYALRRVVDESAEDYIGIGGRHGVSTSEQIKYFDWVFRIIQNSSKPNMRVHAFGITTPEILNRFPFYSADSSAWIKASVFGEVMLRNTLKRISISNNTKHLKDNFSYLPKEAQRKVVDEIEYFGYTLQQLQEDVKSRQRYNIDVLLDWSNNYVYMGKKSFCKGTLF